MIDYPESDSVSSADVRPSLDDAIEQCVLALERGDPDIEALTTRFPDWESEIMEFLENWGGMEGYAAAISDQSEIHEPAESTEFEPHRFGDFELLRKVGFGGMGTIYKARQISLDRIVALKMIRAGRKDDGRFRVEAEAVAALSHPNIVSIFEIGNRKGRQFFSMQFIEGCNLKEYVDQHSITPKEAAKVTETIARAVHYAHQRGILHRDLKPANVLMDVDGKPYVTDFGLAKHIERDTELTQSGTILGTPGYMAPEQASGKVKTLTTATDVYGLGALLYALLTGDAPFTGDSSLHILRRVVDEPASSPRMKNARIDRDLETICLKCLEKSPEQRYASANRLADDLSRFLNHQPVMARPVSQTGKFWRWCRRNPAIACLSSAVLALLVATTLFASFLAYSEYNSRVLSEENTRRESGLNKDLTKALRDEKKASEAATRTRANLLTTNGLWQARNANVGEALLWFSEAATLSKSNAQLHSIQVLSQSWLREHPMPVAATFLRQDYCDSEQSDHVSFQPDGTQILYRSDSEFVVWDSANNEQWHLKESTPDISSAEWSRDGDSIVVGCNDGRVLRVNVNTRRTENIVDVGEGVIQTVWMNGNRLAVAFGKRFRVYDLENARFMNDGVEHNREVRQLVANSQGDRLVVVTARAKSKAILYEISDAGIEKLFETPCHYYSIIDGRRSWWPTFVKNDQALMIRTNEGKVSTFDVNTGELLGRVPLTLPTHCTSVSNDGQYVISGYHNYAQMIRFGTIKKATKNNKNERLLVAGYRLPHDNRVVTASFGSGGLIATGSWNNDVRIWRTPEPRSIEHEKFDLPEKLPPVAVLPHLTRLRRVAFSPDGTSLLTIQIDGLVRLWRIPNVERNSYGVEVEPGGSLVKLVDKNHWMTSGMSHWKGHMENVSVHRFNDGVRTAGKKNVGLTTAKTGHLLDSACSPDNTMLATVHAGPGRSGASFVAGAGGKSGWLRLWSFPGTELLHEAIPMPAEPRWVAWHPDGHQLAVCTVTMDIVLVNPKTFAIEEVWETFDEDKPAGYQNYMFPSNRVNERLDYSPDGNTIVNWSARKPGFWVWDIPTGEKRHPGFSNNGWAVGGITISPDSKRIVVAGGRNTVAWIQNLENGKRAGAEMQHASVVHSARFSPNGNFVITGSQDGHARVFDWQTGELLLDQLTHDADVVDAAYTHDSRFIITLGLDNQLRVWNADDGSLALRPFQVAASSTQLLVSPESRFVIAAGGHIRVVDLGELQQEPELELERARQISELLANKTIVDGALATLSAEDWMERWKQYKIDSESQTVSRQ